MKLWVACLSKSKRKSWIEAHLPLWICVQSDPFGHVSALHPDLCATDSFSLVYFLLISWPFDLTLVAFESHSSCLHWCVLCFPWLAHLLTYFMPSKCPYGPAYADASVCIRACWFCWFINGCLNLVVGSCWSYLLLFVYLYFFSLLAYLSFFFLVVGCCCYCPCYCCCWTVLLIWLLVVVTDIIIVVT